MDRQRLYFTTLVLLLVQVHTNNADCVTVLTDANATPATGGTTSWTPGETITYTCTSGMQVVTGSGVADSYFRICVDTTWASPAPNMCEAIRCRTVPPSLPNASPSSISNNAALSTDVTYTCNIASAGATTFLYTCQLKSGSTYEAGWALKAGQTTSPVCAGPITDVQPLKGPKSGGTLVTVKGTLLDGVDSAIIGSVPCNGKSRTTNQFTCLTGPLTDDALLNKKQNVKIFNKNTGASRDTGFQFIYLSDPTISKIEGLQSIESGGSIVTLTGSNLDGPANTQMKTTFTKKDTGRSCSEFTDCLAKTSTTLTCKTAPIDYACLSTTRKRRQATVIINDRENIEVKIGFVLDAVQKYKNPADSGLPNMVKYFKARFTPFHPRQQEFRSSWPFNDRQVEIKGENLNVFENTPLNITIGHDATCMNVQVFLNKIVCEPPRKTPNIAAGVPATDNVVLVEVSFSTDSKLNADIGKLRYTETLWDHPPARYTIIALICGTFLVIILIIICCVCKKSYLKHEPYPSYNFPVTVQERNMVRGVKRWSRTSPKRFLHPQWQHPSYPVGTRFM